MKRALFTAILVLAIVAVACMVTTTQEPRSTAAPTNAKPPAELIVPPVPTAANPVSTMTSCPSTQDGFNKLRVDESLVIMMDQEILAAMSWTNGVLTIVNEIQVESVILNEGPHTIDLILLDSGQLAGWAHIELVVCRGSLYYREPTITPSTTGPNT